MDFVISAVIVLLAVQSTRVPNFATAANITEQLAPPPSPVLYKCPDTNLPEELVLPTILDEPNKKQTENVDFHRSVFRLLPVNTIICKQKVTLVVNLTKFAFTAKGGDACIYRIKSDGNFSIVNYYPSFEYQPEHYCIKRFTEEELNLFLCDGHGDQLQSMGLNCSDSALDLDQSQSSRKAQEYMRLVLLVGPLTCAAIDTAILLVYMVLWDKQSCYGWSIMTTVISLLSFYAGVATYPSLFYAFSAMQITQLTFLWMCVSTILTMQFAFLCTYCWTLVLAFHVWRMLRTLSPRDSSSQGLRRFLRYCAFGYGLPVFVVTVSLAVFSSGDSNYPNNCFGYVQFVRNWFIYLPTGIVFLCNLVLMYLTVKQLREAKKNREDLRVHGKSEGSSPYTNAVLICKLMVLMGAFLVLDMIIHFLDASGIGESIYSVCFEYLYRISYSACLFWIFVCNNEVRDQLSVKFPALAPYIIPGGKGSSTPTSAATASTTSGSGKRQ